MFVLLVGPKGSGKSHIGRVIARALGVHFFHVEPLWMAYYSECRAAGREPRIEEGIGIVHPHIQAALASHRHVCVETTGAAPEILHALMELAPTNRTLLVRVTAPLELCLERVVTRDQTHQIPMELDGVRKVYALNGALDLDAALVLENSALSDAAIVAQFAPLLASLP